MAVSRSTGRSSEQAVSDARDGLDLHVFAETSPQRINMLFERGDGFHPSRAPRSHHERRPRHDPRVLLDENAEESALGRAERNRTLEYLGLA